MRRGPACRSIGLRSQVSPPTTVGVPSRRASCATASAPTTSPPPPMPTARTRPAEPSASINEGLAELRQRRNAAVGDRADLLRGALELVVGEHRRALEGQLALQLEPRTTAAVLVLY